MKKLLIILLCLFMFPTVAKAWTLPSDRSVTWTGNVGAFTDWTTTRTTVYTTLSPSGSNDADDIQAAINACPSGQVVQLSAGTFLLSTTITWTKDNVTLRGAGMGSTILRVQSGLSGGIVFNFSSSYYNWDQYTNYSITAGATKGSTQITTSSAHGWAVNDFVLIDQRNDLVGPPIFDESGPEGVCDYCARTYSGNSNRFSMQVVKITSIDSTTQASFTPPLHRAYAGSQVVAAKAPSSFVRGISIEKLKVDNSSYYAAKLIYTQGLLNSIFSELRLDGIKYASNSGFTYFIDAAFITVQKSWFENSQTSDSSANYGLWFNWGCSSNLVVNNIFRNIYLMLDFQGSNSGHAILYNYFREGKPQNSNMTPYAPTFHYSMATAVLIEGNYFEKANVRADAVTGTSMLSSTLFRNRITNDATKDDVRMNINLEAGNYYSNIVGNVIGTYGVETKYECYATSSNCGWDVPHVYHLGYKAAWDEAAPYDTLVKTSMLRHYNWDSVTNGTKICTDSGEPGCQGADSDTSIPNSLYYASKPSWFGSQTWPPVDPASPTLTSANKIPAQIFYETGSWPSETSTPPSATGCTMSGAVFQ